MKKILILLVATGLMACANKTKTVKPNMEHTQKSDQKLSSGTPTVDLSMFPKPEAGYKMVVISLPALPNEKDLKLEVLIGKTLKVDCNYYFMMGQSENKTLDGWGYNYTHISTNGGVSGTKMGCPENSTREAFVHMSPLMFSYNSNFPEIIYVPEFCEVRYRTWSASNDWNNTEAYPISVDGKPLIRDCPQEKIINAMPSFGEGGPPKVYYIYKDVRRELSEFDEDWIKKNCNVKTTTAH